MPAQDSVPPFFFVLELPAPAQTATPQDFLWASAYIMDDYSVPLAGRPLDLRGVRRDAFEAEPLQWRPAMRKQKCSHLRN